MLAVRAVGTWRLAIPSCGSVSSLAGNVGRFSLCKRFVSLSARGIDSTGQPVETILNMVNFSTTQKYRVDSGVWDQNWGCGKSIGEPMTPIPYSDNGIMGNHNFVLDNPNKSGSITIQLDSVLRKRRKKMKKHKLKKRRKKQKALKIRLGQGK